VRCTTIKNKEIFEINMRAESSFFFKAWERVAPMNNDKEILVPGKSSGINLETKNVKENVQTSINQTVGPKILKYLKFEGQKNCQLKLPSKFK
jgi:hypothetical protein